MVDQNDDIKDLKKDYKDKLNNFANWFTAIIISNFAYLISSRDQVLDEGLWDLSFYAATSAIALMFIIKVSGIYAAKVRIREKGSTPFEHRIESARDLLSAFFIVLGLCSLIVTGWILQINIFIVFVAAVIISTLVYFCSPKNMCDTKN